MLPDPPRMPGEREERAPRRELGTGAQLGLALMIPSLMVAGPLVGYGIGWALTRWLGWPEWVIYLLVLLGLVAGGRETWIVIRKLTRS